MKSRNNDKRVLATMAPFLKTFANSLHILATSFLLYQYIYNYGDEQSFVLEKEDMTSSIWCTGNNHRNRICRIENLCYLHEVQEFVFFRSERSVVSGIPENRFESTLAELSSVEDHNLQNFQYTELPSTAAKHFDIKFIDRPSLLFNRFFPGNLMHVVHDDLLPLFVTKRRLGLKNLQVVFTDRKPSGPYFELYDILLGSDKTFINHYNSSSMYCFRDARIGVNKETTWYQYGFHSSQGPLDKNFSLAVREITAFRDHMLNSMEIPLPYFKSDPTRPTVLLTRKHNRLIQNEAYVLLTLSRIGKKRVHIMNLEKHTLKDIIKQISTAGMVSGMHGSLLILSIFLPRFSAIVEMFPYGIDPEHYTPYKTLATMPGLFMVYSSWKNMSPSKTVTHPDNPPHLGGIKHLPYEVQEKIKNSSSVPPHKCCYNPEWLFRAYQDTTVDLKTFGNSIEQAVQLRKRLYDKYYYSTFSPYDNIEPSRVGNISCISLKPSLLRLSYSRPWNLDHLNSTEIRYETWIQDKGSEDVKAYVLKSTTYEFELAPKREYLIWTRCLRDDIKGPFTEAISCRVK